MMSLAVLCCGLQAAAEWGQAERLGVVRPSKEGVDPTYDAAKAAVEAADQDLQVGAGCWVVQGIAWGREAAMRVACNALPCLSFGAVFNLICGVLAGLD
jgi:hypothetical protein